MIAHPAGDMTLETTKAVLFLWVGAETIPATCEGRPLSGHILAPLCGESRAHSTFSLSWFLAPLLLDNLYSTVAANRVQRF
jgi:hypothetical protein